MSKSWVKSKDDSFRNLIYTLKKNERFKDKKQVP
jgi:hypothetical protein